MLKQRTGAGARAEGERRGWPSKAREVGVTNVAWHRRAPKHAGVGDGEVCTKWERDAVGPFKPRERQTTLRVSPSSATRRTELTQYRSCFVGVGNWPNKKMRSSETGSDRWVHSLANFAVRVCESTKTKGIERRTGARERERGEHPR